MIKLFYHAVKQWNRYLRQNTFNRFRNALFCPGFYILIPVIFLHFLIQKLTDCRYQIRIPGSIPIYIFCDFLHIHPGTVIFLIFLKHGRNLCRGKTHRKIVFRRNIPRTVIFMLTVRPEFQFQILNIIHSCKNNRMKDRLILPVKIIPSKQCKKIQKHLIITRTVHFIDHQHDRSRRTLADQTQPVKHLPHRKIPSLLQKTGKRFQYLFLIFRLSIISVGFHQHFCKRSGKNSLVLKFCCPDLLKIHR